MGISKLRIFNTDKLLLENSNKISTISKPLEIYRVIFNSGGTWVVPAGLTSITTLLVGGGGGGGRERGGGGGGGGTLVSGFIDVTPNSTLTITIGAGGSSPASAPADGTNGGDTILVRPGFPTLTAYGGGGGGGQGRVGLAGACSGGNGRSYTGAAASASQGRAGGISGSDPTSAGGGGGAAGVGRNGATDASVTYDVATPASQGGPGVDYSLFFGTDVGDNGYFGGGGGGGFQYGGGTTIYVQGGIGGGGTGYPLTGQCTGTAPQIGGKPNTGGGGGGVCVGPIVSGGSGVVIITYQL